MITTDVNSSLCSMLVVSPTNTALSSLGGATSASPLPRLRLRRRRKSRISESTGDLVVVLPRVAISCITCSAAVLSDGESCSEMIVRASAQPRCGSRCSAECHLLSPDKSCNMTTQISYCCMIQRVILFFIYFT